MLKKKNIIGPLPLSIFDVCFHPWTRKQNKTKQKTKTRAPHYRNYYKTPIQLSPFQARVKSRTSKDLVASLPWVTEVSLACFPKQSSAEGTVLLRGEVYEFNVSVCILYRGWHRNKEWKMTNATEIWPAGCREWSAIREFSPSQRYFFCSLPL